MSATIDPSVEDALIPLSALQHHLFCPRQCALIHVEQLWAEDGATAEGRILHERVDGGHGESRAHVRVARGIALRSVALGVSGKADAVEFAVDASPGKPGEKAYDPTTAPRPGRPFPVEYKRGRPKPHRADEVQLCAQAICLEEMLACEVPEGALFYGETRRRMPVRFDAALRSLTAAVAAEARAMIAACRTPAPVRIPGCRRCSMLPLCWPERLERPRPVVGWLAAAIETRSE